MGAADFYPYIFQDGQAEVWRLEVVHNYRTIPHGLCCGEAIWRLQEGAFTLEHRAI